MAYSLVIIQSDLQAAEEMAKCFYAYGANILAIGQTGKDALALARKHRPDVLIIEPFLPFYNCEEIVDFVEEELPLTVKIAIGDEKNERIAELFFDNGGDLFLIRPLDYAYCLKRIEKYHRLRARVPQSNENKARRIIRKWQLDLKMPISVNGFIYIQDAVEIVLQNPDILHHMISGLYPLIAAHHRANPSSVERCIRTAIEKTFEKGDLHLLQLHFSHACENQTGKPANKEFIGILAELVRKELAP